MINKRMFNINNDKKTLHKVGKQWITVSTLLLALISGGAVASKTVSHAYTTNNNVQTVQSQSKQQLNSEKSRNAPVSTNTNIIRNARLLHSQILRDATPTSENQHNNLQSQANNQKQSQRTNNGSEFNTHKSLGSTQQNNITNIYIQIGRWNNNKFQPITLAKPKQTASATHLANSITISDKGKSGQNHDINDTAFDIGTNLGQYVPNESQYAYNLRSLGKGYPLHLQHFKILKSNALKQEHLLSVDQFGDVSLSFGNQSYNVQIILEAQPVVEPRKKDNFIHYTYNGKFIKSIYRKHYGYPSNVDPSIGTAMSDWISNAQDKKLVLPAGYTISSDTKNNFMQIFSNDVDKQNFYGTVRYNIPLSKMPVDYVNYVYNGKVVAVGYNESGKATKFDSDLLTYGSDFTAKKFDKLPSTYKINSDVFNKYNNYFSMIPNSNYGGTQLNIPVELKVQPKPTPKPQPQPQPQPKSQTVNVTVHYVDENGHTIASDNNYKGVAGNPFQFNFKTIPNYSIDFSKIAQDHVITNAKYPNRNWVTTLVYKSNKPVTPSTNNGNKKPNEQPAKPNNKKQPAKPVTPNKPNKPVTPKKPANPNNKNPNKPVTPNKPNNHKQPNKPQVQKATDYVIYIYNGKQVGSNAFTSTGKKGTDDKAFTNFADTFGSDFINNDPQALYINAGLPKGYKLSDKTFSDYGSDFFNNASYAHAYGSDQYKIPVIPNNNKPHKPVVPNKPQVQNGKIDTKFVVVQPNGSYKVINPTNSPDKSDASLKVNGDHVSDYGQPGQTQDVDGTAYDFDTILTPFMPRGYQVSKLNEKGIHGQYDLYDNILNKKDLHFESDGIGDQALEYMKQPQTVYIGVKPIAKPVAKSSIQVRYIDINNNKPVLTVPKATGKVGSEFDLIAYEDKIPAGYELHDIRNQQYFFSKQDQTVDILLSKVPSSNTPANPTSSSKSTNSSSSAIVPSSNSTTPSSQSSSASSSLPEPNLPSSVTSSSTNSSSTSSAQSSQPTPVPKSSSAITPSNSGSNRSSASSRIPKRSAQNRAKIVNKKQSQHVKNRANHSVRYNQLNHSFKSSPIKSINIHNQNKQNKKEQQKLPQTSEAPDNFLALMTLVSIIDGLMFAYACKHRYV